MKNLYYIFSFVSIFLAGVSYIATNSYIVMILVFIISILFFLFIEVPIIRNYGGEINKYRSLHQFINSFIISLSITDSLDIAFANAKSLISSKISIHVDEELSIYDLHEVFPYYTYRLFIDVLRMWEEEGGDILKQSEYLLKSSRNIEERIIEGNRYAKKTLIDFIVLWVVALSIMMFIRFALKDFYGHMVENIIYQIGVGAVIIFLLFSVFMFTSKACYIELGKVKEDD